MRVLALLLWLMAMWLIAAPGGLAQDAALGVWTRADSTVVPAEGYVPEIRVDVRQVEATDSTVVLTAILRATSGEEAGNLIAQRQTLPRTSRQLELAVAGESLTLIDAAVPTRSGTYARTSGRVPEGVTGVWQLPPEVRGPDRIEITPAGHVLSRGDTLFTALAVLGDYVVTTDQDFADKEAYERGERVAETFEVYGLRQLDADRISIHLPPEPALELTRVASAPMPLGTWVNTDTTDIRALYPDVPDWRRAAIVHRQLEMTSTGVVRTVVWRDCSRAEGVFVGVRTDLGPDLDGGLQHSALVVQENGHEVRYRRQAVGAPAELAGTWAGEMSHPETGAVGAVRLRIDPDGSMTVLPGAIVRLRAVGPYLMAEGDRRSGPDVLLWGGPLELADEHLAWPSADTPDPVLLTRQPD